MEIAKWPLSESASLLPIFPKHYSVTSAFLHSFVPAAIFNQDLFDTSIVYIFQFYREIIALLKYIWIKMKSLPKFSLFLSFLDIREIMKKQDTSTSWSPSGLCCIIITSVSWCSRITLLSLGILEGFDRLFPDKIDLHQFLWFFIGCKIVMIHIRWICTRLCFEYFESVWEYPPLSRGEAHEEQGDEMLNVCCF